MGKTSTNVYKRLISSENIYLALYSISTSSIDEYLLNTTDFIEFKLLEDKFNIDNIQEWVNKIHKRIIQIIPKDSNDEGDYLKAQVYFNPKDEKSFRPLHTASLLDQLTMICMLNILIYDIDENNEISISEMGNLLPSNFYGNRVEKNPRSLFKPWLSQYKKYCDDANTLLKKYRDTGEYKYEVVLDLKNFFPSINPIVLYNYLIGLIPIYYSGDNLKKLKKIIEKLIFIKVVNLSEREFSLYSHDEEDENLDSINKVEKFCIGIPQGLPHTYFFANLFMIIIQKEYQRAFDNPKMLFYVDDSIIYTNSEKLDNSNSDEVFKNIILTLNEAIKIRVSKYLDLESDLNKEYDITNDDYKIAVHNLDNGSDESKDKKSKSYYSTISDYREGEVNLSILGRQMSFFSTNQKRTFYEDSDIILLKKAEGILVLVNSEIERIKNKKPKYKDKLIRVKKFLQNRIKILDFKKEGNIKDVIKKLEGDLDKILFKENKKGSNKSFDYDNINNPKAIRKMFSKDYKESTLSYDIKYLISSYLVFKFDLDCIINKLEEINKHLFKFENNITTSYIYKLISIAKDSEEIYYKTSHVNKYYSLNRFVSYKLGINQGKFKKVKLANIYKEIEPLICLNSQIKEYEKENNIKIKNNFLNSYIIGKGNNSKNDSKKSGISEDSFSNISIYINSNSDEIFRMLLNTIFSTILQIELSDNFIINKNSDKLITYFELRILIYLRSPDFNLTKFINHFKECCKKEFDRVIDYSIIEVLQIFQRYVKDSDNIDTLILTHKYVSDIWKNGSKHLYFYTLHNQEHAIELIKNSIKITKAIDLIQITKVDYFILFIACYLHDMSMVTVPNYNHFQGDDFESDIIFQNFNKLFTDAIIKGAPISEIKALLKNLYINIDKYFESHVRNNHARTSAKEIIERDDLSFIESPIRELTSQVSLSHAMNEQDVYMQKSVANDHIISLKFLKILLRLSDVLDMGNKRVSNLLLAHNMEEMNPVSRFHWLSHAITNDYKIEVKYDLIDKKSLNTGFLVNHNIRETIIINVPVNLFQYTPCDSKKCSKVYRSIILKDQFEIAFNTPNSTGDKSINSCEKCIFLCKWFCKKNNFLLAELYALQEYLQSIPNSIFLTEITVRVKSEKQEILTPTQFSYLKDYVEAK